MRGAPTFAIARVRLVAVGLLLTGCAAGRNDVIALNPEVHYPALAPTEQVVLTTTDVDGPYVELGMIHVSGVIRAGYQNLNEQLRRQARTLGADTVIFVHYGTENVFSLIPIFIAIPYDVLTAEGLAVRSKRRYRQASNHYWPCIPSTRCGTNKRRGRVGWHQ